MKLSDILSHDAIIPELKSTSKEGVIEEMSELIVKVYSEQDENTITSKLLEREKLGSTGIESGVAIPHAKIPGLDRIILAVGINHAGIDFDAHDGQPSRIFFVLLAPDSSAGIHLKTLARLSRLLKEEAVRIRLLEASGVDEIYDVLISEDEKLTC